MKHARGDYNDINKLNERIPDDEPVFLIRGQDVIGHEAVREWARLNLAINGDKDMSDRAMKHADLMEAWPKKKKADIVYEQLQEEQRQE